MKTYEKLFPNGVEFVVSSCGSILQTCSVDLTEEHLEWIEDAIYEKMVRESE